MNLFKEVVCERCGDHPTSVHCAICHGKKRWYEEVNPADLKRMNLRALVVLQNLKISLEDMKTGLSKKHPGRTINIEVGAIFELIAELEREKRKKRAMSSPVDAPEGT